MKFSDMNILIADDHSIVRNALKMLLSHEFPNSEIIEAEDGKELLDAALTRVYDLIISDINMPKMDGVTAIGLIRKACPEVPILMLSMHEDSAHCCKALKAGATGYISKSMARLHLGQAIRKILSGIVYVPQELMFNTPSFS
jgi:DNA-binding NarL/FixJ family response regulator